jgi:hypothetical protein
MPALLVPRSGPPLRARVGWWLVAGGQGSVLFWLVQVLHGSGTITAFMGEQIVEAGGYPAALAPFIGWGVHLGVSLSYALVAGLLAWLASGPPRWATATGAVLAAVLLGWLTTAIAPPAISITIALLGSRAWPEALFPLNLEAGQPLWNHILFFVVTTLVQLLGPGLGRRRPAP